ncbi:MAG: hypothetical protein RI883_1042 [Bacteroidota bacterium]|jgi:hypothetical protein
MVFRLFHLIFIFSLPFFCFSQESTKTRYRSPIGIPLVLAANFGELRPNHFHMGVDFKTNGVEGLSLYAVEDGYIARIKISPYGYGKAIYINHPNGVTSVYAHCASFKGKLDSIVKSVQEKEQNFEIELFLTSTDIPVKKGDIIALSGNTGGSTAPHLHFELRDTKTEGAMNPLVYGFEIQDHKPPTIKGLKVYALTDDGYQVPGKSQIVSVSKTNNDYHIANDLITVPSDYCSEHGGIGFAFEVVDQFDAADNICGLYKSILKSGSDTIFRQQIDKVAFDHSRYINSHKDYHEYTVNKRKFHKSFKSEHNPLAIYPSNDLGIIKVKPGDKLSLTYSAQDAKKNKSNLQFNILVSEGKINSSKSIFPSWSYFHPDSTVQFQNDKIQFFAQKHTFYEPTKKNLSLVAPFSFGDPNAPIQYPVIVKMKLPSSKIEFAKYYINVTSSGGKNHSLFSTLNDDWIEAESNYLGVFRVQVDTIPPSLSPLNFNASESSKGKTRYLWKVKENQTELVDYDLFIDGKWYVLEYESKGDYLFFDKPKGLNGKHKVELIVKDSCGNLRKWLTEMVF